MAFDIFAKKKVGDKLSVGFINKLSSVARSVSAMAPGSYQNQQLGGSVSGTTQPPPFFQTLVEISDERINTSDKRGSGLYKCKMLYSKDDSNSSSTDDVKWEVVNKEWELDATATGPVLVTGDRITAWWNQQRGMFIPVVNDVAPVYFKLKKVLNEGGTVPAWVLFWDVKSNSFKNLKEDTIQVKDYRLEGFEAPSGTNGVAYPRTGGNGTVYEIVELFWVARFIEFQLTTDLTTSDKSAKATVVRYWMGRNPRPRGGTLNVYNSLLSNSVYEFDGTGTSASYPSKGFAVFDEHDNLYRIWVMQHQGQDLSAKAQKDWEENNGEPRVSVKRSNDDGSNVRGDAFWVSLPRNRDVENDFDPSVYKDDVIRWNVTNEGSIECKSTYMTSKIGDLKWQKGFARIETGWRLTDGEDEAWDVKGRVLMAHDPDDEIADGTETTPGDDVGFRWHGTTKEGEADLDNNHSPHTVTVSHQNWGDFSPDVARAIVDDIDDLEVDGETLLLHHWGPFSQDLGADPPQGDTDNRPRSKIAVLVERYK